jgi:hypothetical protein
MLKNSRFYKYKLAKEDSSNKMTSSFVPISKRFEVKVINEGKMDGFIGLWV